MKIFRCDSCEMVVFFENVKCLHCGHTLGFLPFPEGEIKALEPDGNGAWRRLSPENPGQTYRQCENSLNHQVCNWMIDERDGDPFCLSCRLNEMIPNLSAPANLDRWHKLEIAKRRLLYSVMRMQLPMDGVPEQNRPRLRFKFVEDVPGEPAATTGHLDGLITINLAEADDPERENRRVKLHEPYRTLVGHMRHEVAHYYWDRLIKESAWIAGFRELFGDETRDYAAAMKQYYGQGPAAGWQLEFVSAYASSHPWEDWAETWAHYFHIIEMTETAGSFGIRLAELQPLQGSKPVNREILIDTGVDFDALLEHWLPLSQALNSLNRCMGLPDAYPFILPPLAVEKLRFIHRVIQKSRGT